MYICFESGVSIYSCEDIIERNIIYEVPKYLKEYYMIGNDGGGRGIFLKKVDNKMLLYYLDLGAPGSLSLDSINISFLSWLENGAILENDNSMEYLFKKVNAYIVHRPENITEFMFDIRKCFNIETSIIELKKGIDTLPYLLIKDTTLVKCSSTVEKINQKIRV